MTPQCEFTPFKDNKFKLTFNLKMYKFILTKKHDDVS